MKEKIIFGYSTQAHSCLALEYTEFDHGWSFSVYSSGTVKLTAWESSYLFTVPQEVIEKITDYLHSKQNIINSLPEELTGLKSTGFRIHKFSVFDKTFSYRNIMKCTDLRILTELAANNIQILAGLFKFFRYCSAKLALKDNRSQNFAAEDTEHREYLARTAAQNHIIGIITDVCKYLHPYGLSIIFRKDDDEYYKFFLCEWNIPNHFYCFDEEEPILKYVDEQSFALYGHGLLQIEDADCIYQLKIPQNTVDRIKKYYKTHRALMKTLPTGDRYKQKGGDDLMLIVFGNKDTSGGKVQVHFRRLTCTNAEIKTANKIFAEVCKYLEPYGLKTEYTDERYSCNWPVPHLNHCGKVLCKSEFGEYSITIYDCCTVHIMNDFYLYEHDTDKMLKTVFCLPEIIVNELRRRILQYKDEIDDLAAASSNTSDDKHVCFNFMGTEIVFNYEAYRKHEEIITKLADKVFKVLEPYGIFWRRPSARAVSNLLFFPENSPDAVTLPAKDAERT